MQEANSDFFTAPDIHLSADISNLHLLHHSEQSYCDIFRIDRMGRFRVLKCLQPKYRGNPLYENLLRKEFEIGYSLRHPGIVEYYGFPAVEGLGNCIEMDWVDGRTLAEEMQKGPLDKALEDKVLEELCDALSYLHSRQVVHRDLKPSNILLTHAGDNVRLIDFGFSDSDTHSILKTPAGTVNYTAPEVLSGGKADARSDIYSLGLIIGQLSRRHRWVVRKCCETRPLKRYSSVSQVKKALHGHSAVLAGVLFILLAAGITLYPYWQKPAESPAETPVQADTLSQQEAAATITAISPTEATPPVQKPAPKPRKKEDIPVDASDIDALFKQATDLFE